MSGAAGAWSRRGSARTAGSGRVGVLRKETAAGALLSVAAPVAQPPARRQAVQIRPPAGRAVRPALGTRACLICPYFKERFRIPLNKRSIPARPATHRTNKEEVLLVCNADGKGVPSRVARPVAYERRSSAQKGCETWPRVTTAQVKVRAALEGVISSALRTVKSWFTYSAKDPILDIVRKISSESFFSGNT
jgi:hypothetical protein